MSCKSLILALFLAGCEAPQAEKYYAFNPTSQPVVKPSPTPKESITILPEKVHFVQAIVAQIKRHQGLYESVSHFTSVPWKVISSLHYREADLNFRCNLANGDPLTARTRHVPAGRPLDGNPPFQWSAAAIDALQYDRLDRANWSTQTDSLFNCEKFNGLGYRKLGIPSPYIYSWSTTYTRGKYVADGKYSPTAVDQQCGVAPILITLQ